MKCQLLRKYRRMANEKFYLEKDEPKYPRCCYRWLHDKEEMKPQYFLCDDGERMWNEKKQCYQCTRDYDEAQKMLREQRVRYIVYLAANEKIRRCGKVKTTRI